MYINIPGHLSSNSASFYLLQMIAYTRQKLLSRGVLQILKIISKYTDSLSQYRSVNYARSILFRQNVEQLFLKLDMTALVLSGSEFAFT